MLADLLAGLSPQPDEAALLPELQRQVAASGRTLLAVDDDPTGVQTVYDTPVLLDWTEAELAAALDRRPPVLFLLTNSRSVDEAEAARRNRAIGAALRRLGPGRVVLASRSDSTLRGHYPAEVLALQDGLGRDFDGHLLVPAFFEGGRYTIADTHWVAVPDAASEWVVPASATPFARDAVFGYATAYLPAWVEEKSHGRWTAADVSSVPLEVVRRSPEAVAERLSQVSDGRPVVVNAASYGDLAQFTLGLLQAEAAGKRLIYRTAASLVRTRAGLAARPLLRPAEVALACQAAGQTAWGGLVVVGSHVPGSTQQLDALLADAALPVEALEIPVSDVLSGVFEPERVAGRIDAALRQDRLVVLSTSRALVTGADQPASLAIGQAVMRALVDSVAGIQTRPRFVIGKGGITSHEVARAAFGARQATALGQLLAGVPVWRLETGARFPNLPYVVFPGNVGGPDALLAAARLLW